MNTLTVAELRHYPGRTFTEQVQSHHDERRPAQDKPPATRIAGFAEAQPLKRTSHGALPVGRRIDIRRFTGRDRLERVSNYLRASVPRTTNWSDESLREVAARLVATTEIVE